MYSRTSAIGASPSQRHRPARPGELALLEVADRVRRVQPVPFEEAAQERLVGRGPGDDAAPPSDDDRGHQSATWAVCADCVGGLGGGRRLGRSVGVIARRRGPARRGARDGRREARLDRAPDDALLGDDARDELGRGDVERRVADLRAGRRDADAAELGDLLGAPLLDLDGGAVGRGEVDRAGRGADVERDAVAGREHGQRVGADLVGRVPVGRHPVRADEDDVDLAAGHQVSGGHVGEQRVGTPAWASSQVVSRAPWRYGRVSSTQTWSGRPAW